MFLFQSVRRQLLLLVSGYIIILIKGQDIKPVNICDNNTVTVDRGYAGIIEHIER